MTQDHSHVSTDQITDVISVALPPIPSPIPGKFSPAHVMLRRAQRRAVERYWDLLCRLLLGHGSTASFDRIEHDPEKGWSIYIAAADPTAVKRLHHIAATESGPGDLLAFEADEGVKQWLRRIEDRIAETLANDQTRGTPQQSGHE